jgi:FkbM family methyltransferase
VNGAKMLATFGMNGVTGNLYVGLHEFEEMAFLLHFLRSDDLFADVGANVGSYTVLAGAAIGAQVIAFEPAEETFSWLILNLDLNKISDHVEARREAVGAKVGTVSFTSGLDCWNRIDASGTVSVPITTLDLACSWVPALIKIDVEGHEADVLRGAERILSDEKTAPAVLMELNDNVAIDLLERYGFACCTYDPFQRNLALRPYPLSGNSNGIFVRDLEQARRRISGAPAFSVRGLSI